jgi:2-phosphoglycerate kinase
MRAILIGGTSHVGKSTLSERLAEELGWQAFSTDSLARHPGRPWGKEVPLDVREYYLSHSDTALLDEVLLHYRDNVWPIAQAIVSARVSNLYDSCIVLEGSAILPDLVNESKLEQTRSIWLIASEDKITERIYASSDYSNALPADQKVIDRFLARSLGYNQLLIDSLKDTDNCYLDVSDDSALDALLKEFADKLAEA